MAEFGAFLMAGIEVYGMPVLISFLIGTGVYIITGLICQDLIDPIL